MSKGRVVDMLELKELRVDNEDTQSRVALDDEIIAAYVDVLRDGGEFPPIVVFFDGGTCWLADGFHRVAAYRAAGAVEIKADIRVGNRRDAILFGVGANATHGLPRNNADKRRAVLTLLNDKEWGQWSNCEIARRANVSEALVRSLRFKRSEDVADDASSDSILRLKRSMNVGDETSSGFSLSSDDSEGIDEADPVSSLRLKRSENADGARTYVTKHGTVAQMSTARIGKVADAAASGADAVKITSEDTARTGKAAERATQQAEMIAGLPDAVRALAAKAVKAESVSGSVDIAGDARDEVEALRAELAALRDENAALRAELEEKADWIEGLEEANGDLRRQVARYDDMVVLYEQGGFDAVVAAKDEEIRVLETRFYSTNADMDSWRRKANWEAREKLRYKQEAEQRGYVEPDAAERARLKREKAGYGRAGPDAARPGHIGHGAGFGTGLRVVS